MVAPTVGPAAVVFDLDGVLVDSEELWDRTRRAVAADAGRPWPAGTTTALQGMSTPEWSRHLAEVVGIAEDPETIAAQVIERMATGYARRLPLLPGAVEAVSRIAHHWTLGLASSSPRRLIDAVLAESGMRRHFTASRSSEEVAAGKPDPAVYLAVAADLDVDPARIVAIEDSSNGLRSAAAAGMTVLAVPHEVYPPAPDALALAAGRVEGVREITADTIAAVYGERTLPEG